MDRELLIITLTAAATLMTTLLAVIVNQVITLYNKRVDRRYAMTSNRIEVLNAVLSQLKPLRVMDPPSSKKSSAPQPRPPDLDPAQIFTETINDLRDRGREYADKISIELKSLLTMYRHFLPYESVRQCDRLVSLLDTHSREILYFQIRRVAEIVSQVERGEEVERAANEADSEYHKTALNLLDTFEQAITQALSDCYSEISKATRLQPRTD